MKAHAAAVKLLIGRGADIKARSNPAPRGRGPALGKANDPRKAVAAQGAALAAGQSGLADSPGQLNRCTNAGAADATAGVAAGAGARRTRPGAATPTGAAGDD